MSTLTTMLRGGDLKKGGGGRKILRKKGRMGKVAGPRSQGIDGRARGKKKKVQACTKALSEGRKRQVPLDTGNPGTGEKFTEEEIGGEPIKNQGGGASGENQIRGVVRKAINQDRLEGEGDPLQDAQKKRPR